MLDQVPQAIANGLLLAALFAIIALGLTLIFGVLDVINFSHGQLVTLGAYLVYEFTRHLSFWAAVPLAMVLMMVGGMAMQVTTFRPVRSVPINGLLVSIGWIAILGNVFGVVWGPNQYNITSVLGGNLGFAGVTVPRRQLLVLVVAIVVMLVLTVVLRGTASGKIMRATAENREAALLMGIAVNQVDAKAFAAGVGLAGLAGGLLVNLFPVSPGLGESYMVYAFVALIVGGAGSAVGAVAGSVLVGLAISLTQTFGSTAVANVAPFIVLIVVLLLRPQGLFRTVHEASL